MTRRVLMIGLGLLLALVTLAVSARTMKRVSQAERVELPIARAELTRIAVAGDRIQTVRGQKQTYMLDNDNEDGSIFVRPRGRYRDRAFNLFIKTEQGRHYTLRLQPREQHAETLLLQPAADQAAKAASWERQDAYQRTLVHLLRDLRTDRLPEGYHPVEAKPLTQSKAGLTFQRLARYEGRHLVAERWRVRNTDDASHHLSERRLAGRGDRALALSRHQLQPGQTAELDRVSDHDG